MRVAMSFFAALVAVWAMTFAGFNQASAAPAATSLANFVVNDVGDAHDATPGDGACATARGVCTLRAAVEESNALAGADVINFDLPPASSIAAFIDELLITDSVTINGPGANQLTVSTGFNFHRVLRVAAAPDDVVHISGLIIAGGVLPVGNGAGVLLEEGTLYLDLVAVQYNHAQNERGGGIAAQGGTLYLTNSLLYQNSAWERGGGLYNHWASTVVVSNTTISGNAAPIGGGIANSGQMNIANAHFNTNEAEEEGGGLTNTGGSLTVANSEFHANSATRGGGLFQDGGNAVVINSLFEENEGETQGGAILLHNDLTIMGSTLRNNRAYHGGAISNQATLTLTQSLVEGNEVLARGGGLYNNWGGVATVNQSTFVGNRAEGGMAVEEAGGAIANSDSTLTLNNSTISGNSAEETAGGIATHGGSVQINHSTIAFNDAPSAGGVWLGSEGMLQVRNSMIARNGAGADCMVHGSNLNGFVAFNANLDSDGSCPLFTLSGEEPQLSILMDNGGGMPTHLLDANSPAVDAGAADGCMAVGNVDQRGFVRLGEGESACDLGALELDGTVPPTPEPEVTPAPEVTPEPEESPEPEETTEPEEIPEQEETPEAEETPGAEDAPEPEQMPGEEESPEVTTAISLYLPNVVR